MRRWCCCWMSCARKAQSSVVVVLRISPLCFEGIALAGWVQRVVYHLYYCVLIRQCDSGRYTFRDRAWSARGQILRQVLWGATNPQACWGEEPVWTLCEPGLPGVGRVDLLSAKLWDKLFDSTARLS